MPICKGATARSITIRLLAALLCSGAILADRLAFVNAKSDVLQVTIGQMIEVGILCVIASIYNRSISLLWGIDLPTSQLSRWCTFVTATVAVLLSTAACLIWLIFSVMDVSFQLEKGTPPSKSDVEFIFMNPTWRPQEETGLMWTMIQRGLPYIIQYLLICNILSILRCAGTAFTCTCAVSGPCRSAKPCGNTWSCSHACVGGTTILMCTMAAMVVVQAGAPLFNSEGQFQPSEDLPLQSLMVPPGIRASSTFLFGLRHFIPPTRNEPTPTTPQAVLVTDVLSHHDSTLLLHMSTDADSSDSPWMLKNMKTKVIRKETPPDIMVIVQESTGLDTYGKFVSAAACDARETTPLGMMGNTGKRRHGQDRPESEASRLFCKLREMDHGSEHSLWHSFERNFATGADTSMAHPSIFNGHLLVGSPPTPRSNLSDTQHKKYTELPTLVDLARLRGYSTAMYSSTSVDLKGARFAAYSHVCLNSMDTVVSLDRSASSFRERAANFPGPSQKDRSLLSIVKEQVPTWVDKTANISTGRWVEQVSNEKKKRFRRKPFFTVVSINDMHPPLPRCEKGTCNNREMYSFVERDLLNMVKAVLNASSNTIVVVASDHGDGETDDRTERHTYTRLSKPSIYDLRTPLFVRMPTAAYPSKQAERNFKANAKDPSRPVTNLDIFPTIAHVLNYNLSKVRSMEHTARGQSLMRPVDVGRVTFGYMGPPVTFENGGKTAVLTNSTHMAIFYMGVESSEFFARRSNRGIGPNMASSAYLASVTTSNLKKSNWTSWKSASVDREYWVNALERVGESLPFLCNAAGLRNTSCCRSTFGGPQPSSLAGCALVSGNFHHGR